MTISRHLRPSPRWLIALVPVVAACSSTTSTADPASVVSDTPAVESTITVEAADGTITTTTDDVAASKAQTTTTSDDVTSSTDPDLALADMTTAPEAALPATIEPGSVEAAAWDALMSPVGEYAAWALYGAVLDQYGDVEPYATIQAAEGRHVDALVRQLERMGVDVPDNPYVDVAVAPDDLVTAAANWATGEVANIELYDDLLAQVEGDARMTRVFTNLRRASEEAHLPMFTAAAEGDGTLTDEQLAELGHSHA